MKPFKSFLKIFGHVAFCAILVLFFCRNSFMRPIARGELYKEAVAGIFLLCMLYLNYLLLIPQFLGKRKYAAFAVLALLSVLASGIGEMLLVRSNVQQCIAPYCSQAQLVRSLSVTTAMVTLRNFGFFCFFLVLRLLEDIIRDSRRTEILLRKKTSYIEARGNHSEQVAVNVDDINYCVQNQNYATIHTKSGKTFEKYCSLRNLEELIGEGHVVRISRSCIVLRNSVENFDGIYMTVRNSEGKPLSVLPVSPHRSEQLLAEFGAKEKSLEESEDSEDDVPKAESQNSDMKMKKMPFNENGRAGGSSKDSKRKTVIQYVRNHPGCKSMDIIRSTGISRGTVERLLKTLKEENRIIYSGNWKTGGYYAVE